MGQRIQIEQDLWSEYYRDSYKQRAPASLQAPEPNICSDEGVSYPETLYCSMCQPLTLAWEADFIFINPFPKEPDHPQLKITVDITIYFRQVPIIRSSSLERKDCLLLEC